MPTLWPDAGIRFASAAGSVSMTNEAKNLALAVNRIDCRVSLRDLNRGAPSFGPLRVPLREAKKFL